MTRLIIIAQSVHCSQESLREVIATKKGTCMQVNVAISRPLAALRFAALKR